jgi:hypothetical protein
MTTRKSHLPMHITLPCALIIVHAGLVLGALIARRQFGWEGLSATPWVVFAWIWFLWPLLAVWPLRLRGKPLLVALLVGAALLVPAVPTLFTLTTWSVGGFAP